MIQPELRDIAAGGNLLPPALPDDPRDCAVPFRATIGPRGGGESADFRFVVVTPAALARLAPTWGRGYLVVPEFDWTAIVQSIAELLALCAAPTWREALHSLDCALQRAPAAGQETDA